MCYYEEYELDHENLELSFDSFKLAFQCMPHLLASDYFRMVFEHLWDCCHLEDLTNGFPQLFQLYSHITQGYIPPQIACVLGVACLLTMTKPSSGVHPIVMGKSLYQLTSHVLCIQFHEAFATHFSPHQFGITTKGGCETIIHGIKCTLDLHPNWVVLQLDVANTFNLVSRRVIVSIHCTPSPLRYALT